MILRTTKVAVIIMAKGSDVPRSRVVEAMVDMPVGQVGAAMTMNPSRPIRLLSRI